jgi:hypothetical protein
MLKQKHGGLVRPESDSWVMLPSSSPNILGASAAHECPSKTTASDPRTLTGAAIVLNQ